MNTIIILIILGILVGCIPLYAQHHAYKTEGKEINKIGLGSIIMWIIVGIIFVFGCFGNLLGVWGGDLSEIGGR